MPIYPIDCPECGSREGFSRTALAVGDKVECFECPAITVVSNRMAVPNVVGTNWVDSGVKGRYSKQAGRYFENRKQMEQWAESKNLAIVSSKDSSWTSIREANREEREKDAKAEGFRDAEHRSRELKENSEEYRHQAAQKQIDRYHDEHGNEGKRSTDEHLAAVDAKAAAS